MIVVDVETTGTDPRKHSLVSIGALDLNNPDIRFYEECRIWEGAHVMPKALEINGFTEEEIKDPNKQTEIDLVKSFLSWFSERDNHVIAGINVFFDTDFIRAAAGRGGTTAGLSYRVVDLHTLVYAHMLRRGLVPPLKEKKTNIDGDTSMAYVGIPAETKPHVALNGAIWEAEAFHRLIYGKPLLPEFRHYPIPWENH